MKEYVPSQKRKIAATATKVSKNARNAQNAQTQGGGPAKATSHNGRGSRATANLTPLAIVFRYIKPHWRNYIDYVRMAVREGDGRVVAFLEAYDRLTKREQSRKMPEDICELAGIAPSLLGGAVAEQVLASGMNASQILAGMEHPRVMAAVAKEAQKKDGYSDRALFLRATGSLPKEGASVVVHNNTVALAGRQGGPNGNGSLEPMGRTPGGAGGSGGFRNVSSSITKMDRLLSAAQPPVTEAARQPVNIGEYVEIEPDSEIDLPDEPPDDTDD